MPRPQTLHFDAPPHKAKQKPLRQTHKKTHKKASKVEHKLVTLTGKQRTYLRGKAHDLNPVLQIGKAGLTPTLLQELDRTLDSHELIKIRLLRECPDDADAVTLALEKKLKASIVGQLGHVVVLYRRNPEATRITLPTSKKAPALAAPELPEDFDDDDDDSNVEYEEEA